ncbi:hypothetical protein CW304_03115 [Bacillus sp. UFRGS-B20]|nr:hypothetical protein CW304_03115 [Bacillus sp. UFRGS-B20]
MAISSSFHLDFFIIPIPTSARQLLKIHQSGFEITKRLHILHIIFGMRRFRICKVLLFLSLVPLVK